MFTAILEEDESDTFRNVSLFLLSLSLSLPLLSFLSWELSCCKERNKEHVKFVSRLYILADWFFLVEEEEEAEEEKEEELPDASGNI
jgi:hypothetical protein